MATLEQLAEGIRRADKAGDAEAVRVLGQAYRSMQQQGGGRPVMQDGQQIGAEMSGPGEPLRIMVDGSPEPQPNPVMDAVGRFGQSVYSSGVGALQGLTMGAYDEVASALGTPVKAAQSILSGTDGIQGANDIVPFIGRSYNASRAGQKALTNQAYEQAPAAFIAGDLAGSVGLGAGLAGSGATMFGKVAQPTIAGMAGRGAVEGGLAGFGTGFNSSEGDGLIDRLSGGVGGGITGGVLGGITGGILGAAAGRQQNASVPSSRALKDAGGDIFNSARNSGVIVPAADFDALAAKVSNLATSQNVLLPNGRVNSTYADLAGPLEVLEAYKGRPVDIGQLLTIRTNIRDAAANPKSPIARIGMEMLDEFNDYLYKLYPQLEQADDLYWRGKAGELIDKMGELATSRAGQYSQSGIENALRGEFRLLERQIIKGRVKGLPPELVKQISKVAQGDDIQNFARWVSKFGLQNPVTSLTGVGAGLATGSLLPAVGIWGAAQGAGAAARAMALEKYAGASALARSGGNLPAWQFAPGAGGIVQAIGQQAAKLPPAVGTALYGRPRSQ